MAGGLYWIYLILNRIPLLVVFVGWLPAVGESDFFSNGRCGSAGECAYRRRTSSHLIRFASPAEGVSIL